MGGEASVNGQHIVQSGCWVLYHCQPTTILGFTPSSSLGKIAVRLTGIEARGASQ
jgi:hypothetical protein